MLKSSSVALAVFLVSLLSVSFANASDKNRLRRSTPRSKYQSIPVLGRDSTKPLTDPSEDSPIETANEKNARIMALLRSLNFRGSLDLYYLANFNRPAPMKTAPTATAVATQNTYRVFDTAHDSMQFSYAHFVVQKQAEPVGVLVDLAYGPAMQTVSGTLTDVSQMGVKQIVLSYLTKGGLLFEAGRFVTHVGYEVIESQDNWNYSRGLLFGYFIPFWHQGVKISYPFGDSVSATVLIVNGWNNSYDFNANKNIGAQINWIAIDALSFCFNYLTGQEPGAVGLPGGERKSVYDFIATVKASDVLSFAVNADYLTFAAPLAGQVATGLAFYARYDFVEDWALSSRFEFVDDKDNLAMGGNFSGGQSVTGVTVTLESRISQNLITRLEARSDRSTKEAFVKDGSTTSSQETATISLVGAF